MVLSPSVVTELKHAVHHGALPISLSIVVRIMTQTGASLLRPALLPGRRDLQLLLRSSTESSKSWTSKVYVLGTERHV
jgi:ribosomal protein S10